jgi:hypothetical protein
MAILILTGYYGILNIRKAPTPKWMLPRGFLVSFQTPPILWVRQDRHFLFSLVLPIEIGKQCNNQTAKGYQQANNPYEYQYNIRSRHMHHLPSYVFRLNRL